jgi:hypothetical protein
MRAIFKDRRPGMAVAAQIAKLEKRQLRALERAFPIGTTVRFHVMYGQVNPTIGDVIGYETGSTPYLRVMMKTKKPTGRSIPVVNVW